MLNGMKEDAVLKWANDRVEPAVRIKNLRDQSLKTGQFFFRLLASIEPRIIDWELVKPGLELLFPLKISIIINLFI